MKKKIELSLYIYGLNTANNRAIARLIKALDERLLEEYKFNVFDLKKDPVPGFKNDILVTPTLVRDNPVPTLRVTGNLNDYSRIMSKLELLGGK